MTKTFKVTTEGDCEGKGPSRILGYVTGDPEDIEIFYDDLKEYTITVKEIEIVHINLQTVKRKEDLLERQKELETKQSKIQNELELLKKREKELR